MNFGGSHTKDEVPINNATKPFLGGYTLVNWGDI